MPGELGIIPMNLLPFLAVFHARSNSTGHEILVKMGVNSLRLHLYAWLIELGIIPVIPTQFEGAIKFYPPWSNLTGQSNSTGHEILIKLGRNSLRLHHHLSEK